MLEKCASLQKYLSAREEEAAPTRRGSGGMLRRHAVLLRAGVRNDSNSFPLGAHRMPLLLLAMVVMCLMKEA